MNNTDVVNKISQTTGVDTETCAKLVKAFEGQSEEALKNKFKGIKHDPDQFIDAVATETGCNREDCEKVVNAINEVLDTGLSNKLKFFKRK